jgi:hypothetical protein
MARKVHEWCDKSGETLNRGLKATPASQQTQGSA